MAKRILIIDDEPLVRQSIRLGLRKLGHEIDDVENGSSGISLIKSNPYDLVISDIVMPGMSGIEVISEIRKQNDPIKVIAISGGGRLSDHDYLQEALANGADATLRKPIMLNELREIVSEVLDT